MFQFPRNAIILFFKATQLGLFEDIVPIKGHMRDGHFIKPTMGKRRKAREKAPSDDLFAHLLADTHAEHKPATEVKKPRKPRKPTPEQLAKIQAKVNQMLAHAKVDAQHAPNGGQAHRKIYLAMLDAMKGIPEDVLEKAKQDIEGLFGAKIEKKGSDGKGSSEPPDRISEAELNQRGQRVRQYVDQVNSGTAKHSGLRVGIIGNDAAQRIADRIESPVDGALEVVVANAVIHATNKHPDMTGDDWTRLPKLTNQFDDVARGRQGNDKKTTRIIIKKGFPDGSGYGAVLDFAGGVRGKRLNLVTYFKGHGKSLEAWWNQNKLGLGSTGIPNFTESSSSDPSSIPKPDTIVPPPAPGSNTAPAGEQDVQRQMAAVRQRYQGTAQWLKAPNGQPTKLNERQWLQVRTPAFKQWFGDWEYAAHQQAIDKLPTVPVDFELDNAQSLAEARHQALAEAKRRFALDQNPKKVITPNGDGIWIAMSGLKESISKHAGPQKMRILPILDRLIENSHFVLAAPDAKTEQRKTPNILGYRYYVAKAKLGEKAYYVKLAVREVEDRGVKRKFYDHDLSEVSEVTREQGTAHLAAAGNPTAMTSLDHIVHQGWQKFNEEASKVIDENGEPLVVYRMTRDMPQSGDPRKTYWTSNPAVANSYMRGKDALELKMKIIPAFVRATRVLDAGGMRTDQRGGHAFIWAAEDILATHPEAGPVLVRNIKDADWRGVERQKRGHDRFAGHVIVALGMQGIKSALGNRGTFDGNEGDITKSFHPTRRLLFLKAG